MYPNKSGTVHDLIEEAKKQIEVNDDWSGKLRLLEVTSYKIHQILPEDILLECLNPSGSKTYRIEETPKDELRLEAGEFLVPVAHFHKEAYQTFGVPFLLKLKHVSDPYLLPLALQDNLHIYGFILLTERAVR